MIMKKLVFLFSVIAIMGANALSAAPVFSLVDLLVSDYVAVCDGNDADLYLDCFENAVKSKDMELAAKVANVLYGMEMNEDQQNRFTKIEDMISRKDYQEYRNNLRYLASKSTVLQDDYADDATYGYEDNYQDYEYVPDSEYGFVDEMIDAFSSFFNGMDGDTASWHYERHDTLDGGGFVDVFVDTFGKYMFDDASDPEMQSKRSDANTADIDALLDDYENFVNLSVDALRRVMSGDEAALKDFEEYSEKASAVAEDIDRRGNAMNSEQFKRYMHILGTMVTGLF